MRPGEMWRRFRYFLGRDRLSAELQEEMRLHVERRESQLVEAGVDPREATAQARKEFGNETVLAERSREEWGWSWVDTLLRDLRYAFRQLRRSPGFAIAAIATLGLGIGATTAIFSVVNGVLLRGPSGIAEFDELVAIYTSDYSGPPYGASSLPDLRDFESGAPALSGVAAYTIAPVVLSDAIGSEPAEMILGQVVTPTYFDVLGARTTAGRAFAPGEGRAGGRSDVVVLGHEFWRGRFGGDLSIVGETITLAGASYTVVGVAEERFLGLLPAVAPAFFVPVGAPGISSAAAEDRGSRGFFAVGRLAGGATIEQARTQLQSVAAGLHEQYPEAWTDVRAQPRAVTMIPAREAIVPPQIAGTAFGFAALLMAIVGGVLLIGCANIANLLLARAIGRRREIGIRLAIGARRGRVVRQMLTESTVLAGFGALFGLVIASIGTRALAVVPTLLPLPITLRLDITPDLRVLGFATAVTVVAGLLSGLAPALVATRENLVSSLHRVESGGRRLGLRAVLVAGQIAVAVVLLAAGGLLLRSLLEAQAVDPGFRTDGLLSVSIALDEPLTPPEERPRIRHEVVQRIGALPGVSSASYGTWLPLGASGGGRRAYRAEGYTPAETEDLGIDTSDAGPDFFQTIGTRLVRGREFAPTDRIGVPRVAIVNEAFVRRYLSGQDPLGKRLLSGGDSFTVVGVAEDGKYRWLGEDPQPFVWRAADQWPSAEDALTIVVRAGADAGALAQPVRQIVADVAPNDAITDVAIGDQHLSISLLPQRIGAWLLGLFGALGLGLAALGIYSVMAYAVSQRTREFGIRLALGARMADITKMVVGQGMVVCAIGGAVGLILAAGATQLMQFLLFGVSPLDPVTFGVVVALVFAVTLLANWLPALRTAKADPLESLRFD
ncbi:MAG: FtsX-like permease family protein [Gemmatimonas sp.]|nr:FtsX-like permease family protein [Gemmatimonas sp.]